MHPIRAIYNRRKAVKRLLSEGRTPAQIAGLLHADFHTVCKDASRVRVYGLPDLDGMYSLPEIAERLGISKSEVRNRMKACCGGVRPDTVFMNTFFFREESFAKLPSGPLRRPKEPAGKEPVSLDRLRRLCALRAAGIPVREGAVMLGMTPEQARRLINRARARGMNVHQMVADCYADLCLAAYRGQREFPPPLPMGGNLALTARVTAYAKGVPIELIASPGDTCWSPDAGRRELDYQRGQLRPDDYRELVRLVRYKVAVWELRTRKNGITA